MVKLPTFSLAAFLLATVISAPAHADFLCTGNVVSIGAYHDGGVIVDIGQGPWWLCNGTSAATYGGITTDVESCNTWKALLLSSQRAGTSVGLYITSPTVTGTNPAQCSSVAAWSYPGIFQVYTYAN
jgi:hypothetical protein